MSMLLRSEMQVLTRRDWQILLETGGILVSERIVAAEGHVVQRLVLVDGARRGEVLSDLSNEPIKLYSVRDKGTSRLFIAIIYHVDS